MRKTHMLWAALASLAVAGSASATDEHREMGPHVHGHGKLNIAIEGNRVEMELQVPGADIVGFEHEAKTSKQKAAIEQAKIKLADVQAVFRFPADANCKTAKADVTLKAENHGKHDHAKHDHDKHKHDDDKAEPQHSEFHARYTLECAAPEKIASIDFAYFKTFAGAQELGVNVVTATAQNQYEVTRKKPTLKLAE